MKLELSIKQNFGDHKTHAEGGIHIPDVLDDAFDAEVILRVRGLIEIANNSKAKAEARKEK